MHQTGALIPACFTRHDALVMVGGMMDPKVIDDLARRLSRAVPSGLREAQQDIEKNFRTVLQNTLAKMDLVTREEFDVQSRLLARTREKLEALEKAMAELEAGQPKD
jgi:BMFP domain-containing protein YqiC